MCFNAFKHHKFGWFAPDQTEFIDTSNGPWTGELAAFVDAKQAASNQAIIIRLGTTYMQLNSAKSFNSGTKEKKNKVVLVKGTWAYLQSDVVAGLGAGDSISVEGDTVQVCDISFGSVDYATISIFKSGQSSGCPGGSTGPRNRPWYCFIPFLC